jgi:hypothetical protein
MRPGSYTSSDLVHVTYFSAGVRVYDISDPISPTEVERDVPEARPDGR